MSRPKLPTLLCVLLAASASQVFAAPADDIDDLKAQVEALKATVQRLEEKIDALSRERAQTATIPPVAPAAPSAPTARPPVNPPSSLAGTLQAPGSTVRDRDQISGDQRSAPRVDNALIDPELKGFFHFPGTDAIAKIDGYMKMDFIHDLKYAGDPDLFITSLIPVGANAPHTQVSNLQFKQSRLNFEMRRDTQWGNLRFYYENDFFGPAGTSGFNLRNAYGQLGNFLVGFTYSNFMDPDALVDTLDYEGPGATIWAPQAQVRAMAKVSESQSVSFSVEKPSADIRFPVRVAIPLSAYPDGVVNWRLEQDRFHIQTGALFRQVALDSGAHHASAFGWGVNLTGAVNPFGDDNLALQVAYGRGASRYFADLGGLGLDAALNTNLQLEAVPAFGTYASYTHHWSDKLRSSFTYGYLSVEPTGLQLATTFHHSNYANVNLIWRPVGSMVLGAEYIYGWQRLQNGQSGIGSRIQISAGYNPFRRVKAE